MPFPDPRPYAGRGFAPTPARLFDIVLWSVTAALVAVVFGLGALITIDRPRVRRCGDSQHVARLEVGP